MAQVGSIVVSLEAKIDNLQRGFDKAQRQFDGMERHTKKLEQSFRRFEGAAASLGAALATIGVGALVRGSIQATAEVGRLSRAFGVSSEALSTWQFAAKSAGVDAGKVGDIFKDLSDKLGDFAATGGGEAKDLFERLNLDIQQLINLSPDKQLLAIADALDTVQSRSEKIFLLESLADDASRLLPLLEDGAAGFKELQREAKALGVVIGEDQVRAAQKAERAVDRLSASFNGMIRSLLSSGALDSVVSIVDDLGETFKDPAVHQGIAEISRTLGGLVKTITENAPTVLKVIAAIAGAKAGGFLGSIAGPKGRIAGSLIGAGIGLSLADAEEEVARAEAIRTEIEKLEATLAKASGVTTRAGINERLGSLRAELRGIEEAARLAGEGMETVHLAGIKVEGVKPPKRLITGLNNTATGARKAARELTELERAQAKFNRAIRDYPGQEMVREIDRQFDSIISIDDAMEQVQERAGAFEETFKNTFRRLDDSGASFWRNLLEGGENAFGSLKDLAIQTAAEIAHSMTTRRLTQGISNAIVPGAAAGIGAAQLGGFSMAGMGTSLLNAGVSPFTNASTFMQSAGLTGNLGIAAGGALPGLGVGALTTLATGGSGVGNAIGGAIGGAIGNVLLPGIGGLVGSALGGLAGGLFGGSKKAKIRLGGGAGGFEDSVFSQSAFGQIGFAADRTKRVDAGEFKPFFDSIAQLDNVLASSVAPEKISEISTALEGFTSSKLTSSDPFRPEQLEQLMEERFDIIFDVIGQGLADIDRPLQEVIADFVGFQNALTALQQAANPAEVIGPFEASLRQLEAVFSAGSDAAGRLGLSIDELQASFDSASTQLTGKFNQDIQQAILAIQDPLAADLAGLDQRAQALRREAEVIGGNIAAVNTLIELEKGLIQSRYTVAEATESAIDADRLAALAQREFAQAQQELLRNLNSARSDLVRLLGSEASELERTKNQFEGFARSLRDFRQGLLTGPLSPLGPEQQLAQARQQFESIASRARLGDVDAIGQLEGVSQTFLTASRDFFASNEGFVRDFERVQSILDSTETVAERQANIADRQLSALNNQIDILNEISGGVQSLEDAIRAFAAAEKAAMDAGALDPSKAVARSTFGNADAVRAQAEAILKPAERMASSDFIQSAFQKVLGRAAEASAVDFFSKKSEREAAQIIFGSSESANIRGFASGGVASGLALVGEQGPELVNFRSPSRVHSNADTRQLVDNSKVEEKLDQANKNQAAMIRLSAEGYKRMLAEMAEMRRELADIRSTGRRKSAA